MKRRINLLNKKKHFNRLFLLSERIKKWGTIFGVVLFAFFLVIIVKSLLIKQEEQQLLKKKELYLSFLSEEKDIEANTRFFKGKLTQLQTFEKDDAHFVPYYTLLVNTIDSSSQSASLYTVDIDKNRSTTFIVKFLNYEGMINFLKYIESSDFLMNFDALSMASLNLTRSKSSSFKEKTASKSYQLQFEGKFKQIK